MQSSFKKNEIFMSCEYLKSHELLPKEGTVINVIGNNVLCDYISNTLKELNSKTEYRYTVYQVQESDALSSTVSKQCFLYCLDTRRENDELLEDIKKALDYACKIKKATFLALVIIPPLCKREDIEALSEIELSKISLGSFLGEVENTLSDYCDKIDLREIRFDNFLIDNNELNPLNLTALIKGTRSLN